MMEDVRSLGIEDLQAAVRAAASAYGSNSFVVVGRASLAATLPDCDAELRATMDVDLFPPWDESKAAAWAAADVHIGRVSDFRRQHGFYVERVAEWTIKLLPHSWVQRVTRFEVDDIQVLAINPMDLVYAKLQAARLKDLLFVRSIVEHGVISRNSIELFIFQETQDDNLRSLLIERFEASRLAMEDEDE